jgi:DNA polymerase zeta
VRSALAVDVHVLHREFARVFGVDFMSVITRGSQLKVEAFMFRLAKQESFILVSPSREDVSVSILLMKSGILLNGELM